MTKYIAHFNGEEIHSVKEHLLGTAELCESFLSKIGIEKVGYLIGAFHDYGKYSNLFQEYMKQEKYIKQEQKKNNVDYDNSRKITKGSVDHSTAGGQYLYQYLTKEYKDVNQIKLIAEIIAICIFSHHSGLIDCLTNKNSEIILNINRRLGKEISLNECNKNSDLGNEDILKKLSYNDLNSFYNKIFNVYKNTTKENKEFKHLNISFLIRYIFSCLIDADRIDTINFANKATENVRKNNIYCNWDELCKIFECHISSFTSNNNDKINCSRKEISNDCKGSSEYNKGFFKLTAPTGSGKTLSSMRFALHHAKKHNMNRIINIIPFTSIIDQNAETIRQILENNKSRGSIILEHHSNILNNKRSYKEKIFSENWDSQIVFSTMVQFLETFFNPATSSVRRLHQLHNSIICFDEIQSLPIKFVHLFNNALNFLVNEMECTVVMGTATQPNLDSDNISKEFGGFKSPATEIIKNKKKHFDVFKRTHVDFCTETCDNKDVALEAISLCDEYNSCVVIVNTKSVAKSIFEEIKKKEKLKLFHLSTNMCAYHRKNILNSVKNLLKRGEKVICVSTQLIEAGVDIDFGSGIRSWAGLGSIAQSAGRVNRNGYNKKAKLKVVNLSEKLEYLPDIKIEKDEALHIYNNFYRGKEDNFNHNPFCEEIMSNFFKRVFFNRKDDMKYPLEIGNCCEKNKNGIAGLSKQIWINDSTNENDQSLNISFKTVNSKLKIFDDDTTSVLVPYENGLNLIKNINNGFSFKEAQQYTINIRNNKIEKNKSIFKETNGVTYIEDENYYSEEYGLNV